LCRVGLGMNEDLTMKTPFRLLLCGLPLALVVVCGAASAADDVGQIKVAKGQVAVDRDGRSLPAEVGMSLATADVLRTGADGSVGITMRDNSLLSAGPNSVLSLDRFEFDPTTHQGRFDSRLERGTLAVVSGRLARQSPQAMTVRTPSAVMGVRGTDFVVSVP
jgi:hypothetical protein